jgi:hypothetical protein
MAQMKAVKNAVCTTGKYMKDGVEKKQYTRVGKLFKYDDGGVVLKVEAIPVNFDGWINFYPLDDKQAATPEAPAPVADGIANDDIPF